MRYPDRVTLCVSSQAGCGMACPFCATGQGGLTATCPPREIVEQVAAGRPRLPRRRVRRARPAVQHRVHGHGRADGQLQAGADAVRLITGPAPHGLGISARSVTVSTVGLVPAIDKLTDEGLQVRLAVSLHAPDDELRDEARPGQLPLEDRRGPRRRQAVRRPHRPPGQHRVRADSRHQRPAVASRPARLPATRGARPAGARQPDPVEPHARGRSGTPARDRFRTNSSAGCTRRASPARSATPAVRTSTLPAASSPPPSGATRTPSLGPDRSRRRTDRRGRSTASARPVRLAADETCTRRSNAAMRQPPVLDVRGVVADHEQQHGDDAQQSRIVRPRGANSRHSPCQPHCSLGASGL